jgi:hypothetical protein
MPRPSAPPWRGLFLRELGRTGSVAAAADRAGIDRSSAYQLRRRNPAFAASWGRAKAAAVARFGAANKAGRAGEPARASLRLRGDETVRASGAGRPCIVRAGPGRWSRAAEEAFLATLCATANVKAAAAAAGVSAQAAYARRRQWPAFAQAWDEAKAEGYARLELLLLHAATATLDPPAVPTGVEPPEMSYDQALNLLRLRQGSLGAGAGRGRGYAWRAQEPDIEDVRAEIMRKLAALERARGGRG